MKFSKAELVALSVTAAALTLFAGWFFHCVPEAGSYRVSGSHLKQAPPSATARTYIPDVLVDLNRAALADLMGLPGIGESRAQAILDYRAQNGPFQTPEELLNISGIGQTTLARLRPYITVTSEEGGADP